MDFISIFLYFMEVFFIASNKNNQPINEQIKASHVLVIGPNGEQVGVKPIQDALTLANYAGLDLVMLNPNQDPPVCKVMDYNEFLLSPVIDVGDFDTKLKQVTKYLEKGDKIKLSIRFKGRQMAHTELGREVLDKFAARLENISTIEQNAKLDGRTMIMLLAPKKEK